MLRNVSVEGTISCLLKSNLNGFVKNIPEEIVYKGMETRGGMIPLPHSGPLPKGRKIFLTLEGPYGKFRKI